NSEMTKEQTAEGTDCHPRRRLTGAGPLQHITYVTGLIFQSPCEIDMTRTRSSERAYVGSLGNRLRRHRYLPVGPVSVIDLEGNRTADGFTVPHSGLNLDLILLYAHASAAAVTQLAPVELEVDELEINRKTRGKTFEHANQTLAMRLT